MLTFNTFNNSLFVLFLAGLLQLNISCYKPIMNAVITMPTDTIPATNNATMRTYLALGDSYTIGQSVPDSDNYPMQTVSILNNSGFHFNTPEIISTIGWTTADLLNAIANKPVPIPAYDIVTLLIGVNNQYQGKRQAEYKDEFTTLLQRSIVYAGNRPSHVIVLSIPDYAVSPYGQSIDNAAYISSQIDSFNLINKWVAIAYNVNYINITDTSRNTLGNISLFAYDGLHFSGKEYKIWANMLVPVIEGVIK